MNVPVELVVVELVVVLVSDLSQQDNSLNSQQKLLQGLLFVGEDKRGGRTRGTKGSDILPDHRPPLPALIFSQF